jgi:hypothetical protein
MLARAIALALFAAPLPSLAGEPQCGPHEHVVTERDDEEGSIVKRCVCDEGWDADGPGKPCRQAKGGAKGGKAEKEPAKKPGR